MELATLLEGVGLAFDISKVSKCSKIKCGCFEAVELDKEVIYLLINHSNINTPSNSNVNLVL